LEKAAGKASGKSEVFSAAVSLHQLQTQQRNFLYLNVEKKPDKFKM
jgi:ATP-dependent helicase YprA (DUF1998 family)